METWLAASVSLPDGRIKRYGPDEHNVEDQPSDLSFDTGPGGFGSAQITLPRPFGPSEWSESRNLNCPVEIYDAYGTVYEGFIVGTPQAGPTSVTLQLAGWVSVLDMIETFRARIVDSSLEGWEPAAGPQKQGLYGLGFNYVHDASVDTDVATSLPNLHLQVEPDDPNQIAIAVYDIGPGQTIDSIYMDAISVSTSDYVGQAAVQEDDAGTGFSAQTDFLTGTNSSFVGTYTPSIDARYGVIMFHLFGTPGSTPTSLSIRRLKVFGKTGITKRGTAPNQGVYQSDVIAYALGFQSSLNYTLGDSIEETSFVLEQVAYGEDTTLRTVIENMTVLGGNQIVPNEWGVYENREFFWKSPGTHGRTWYVRQDENATAQSDGPDIARRVAGIKINYDDGSGKMLSVGPPGSNSDYETTELVDPDPDNPAHRIPGAFKTETIGIVPVRQDVINIGVNMLNSRNQLDWRGSIQITGTVRDEHGNEYPVNRVRWGDRVVVADSPDLTPRPVSQTSFDQGSLTNQVSIGDHPDTEESVLGRLGVVTDLYR